MSRPVVLRLPLLFALLTALALGCGDDGVADPDASSLDGALPDGAVLDGGLADGALPDGALPDSALPDSGVDGGGPAPETCGNGGLDDGEVCDAELLGGATCESVVGGGGTLGCTPNCLALDTSGCECVPRTCDALECGDVDDGCGGTLDCGVSCPGTLSCGGAGVAGRCGQPCGDCPAGSSCDADGLCAGFDSTGVDLDFSFATVSFEATPGGSAAPSCADITQLRVRGPGSTSWRDFTPTCSGGSARASLVLAPGEHTVQAYVRGYGFLRQVGFTVGSSASTVSVPVMLETVQGHVLHNGAVPVRDSICSNSRTPTGRLEFLDASNTEVERAIVDCRDQFSFESITLERGSYTVVLVAQAVEFAAIEIGVWPVLLGSVDISGAESDLRLNFRTYHLGGVLTAGGNTIPCEPGEEIIVTIDTGDRVHSGNQTRHSYTCDSSGRIVMDMNLPYGLRVTYFGVANPLVWVDSFDALDADTTNLDLDGVLVSGPLVRDGAAVPCSESGTITVSLTSYRVRALATECVGGRLWLPTTVVRPGTVRGTFAGSYSYSFETEGDRLDTDIELFSNPTFGSLRGAVTVSGGGDPAVLCDYPRLRVESLDESGVGAALECDASMVASYSDTHVSTGTWPLFAEGDSGDVGARLDLGSATVSADTETVHDITVPVAAANAVRVGLTYDGVVPAGVTEVSVRADFVYSDDALRSLPAPLPGHIAYPARDLWVRVTQGTIGASWSRDAVAMPSSGDVTLDVSPVMVSGTVSLAGVSPSAGCTRLARLYVGNAFGDVDCAGNFGPLPVEPGASAVSIRLYDVNVETLDYVAGPVLLVE